MKLQGPAGGRAMSPRARPLRSGLGTDRRREGRHRRIPSYVARGPEGIVDAINIALQLAFILIFVIVLVRYLRAAARGPPRPGARVRVGRGPVRDRHRPDGLARRCRGRISQLASVVLLLQPYPDPPAGAAISCRSRGRC